MQWVLDKYNRLLDTRAMPMVVDRSASDQLYLQFDQSFKALFVYHNDTQLEMFFVHPLVFAHEITRKNMRMLFSVKNQLDGSVTMKFRVRFTTPESVGSFCRHISEYIDVKEYALRARSCSSGAASVIDLTTDDAASQHSVNMQGDESMLQSSSSTTIANISTYSLPFVATSMEDKATQTDAVDANVNNNNKSQSTTSTNQQPGPPTSSSASAPLNVHIQHLFEAEAVREFGIALRNLATDIVDAKKKKQPKTEKKKTKKEKKQLKDPALPKKPLSSYFLFFLENRERIMQEHGGGDKVKGSETMARVMGEQWKALPNEQKEHWKLRAAVDKLRYQNEMDEYNNKANGPAN